MDPDTARDSDLLRVFQAWVTALRSPSVSLKEHGFRRLSDVLESVCQLWQVGVYCAGRVCLLRIVVCL